VEVGASEGDSGVEEERSERDESFRHDSPSSPKISREGAASSADPDRSCIVEPNTTQHDTVNRMSNNTEKQGRRDCATIVNLQPCADETGKIWGNMVCNGGWPSPTPARSPPPPGTSIVDHSMVKSTMNIFVGQDDSTPAPDSAAPATASLEEVRDLVSKTLESKGVLGSIKAWALGPVPALAVVAMID
jgi:hypothetical protein